MLRLGVCGLTSDHVWSMVGGFFTLGEKVEVVAAAEPYHPELLERAKADWAVQRTYTEYETLLQKEEVDAVVICANNRDKAEIVRIAARCGRHVMTDKPMAATLAQAAQMERDAAEAGIHLMVAYHNAFSPMYAAVKQLIAQGAIGTVYLAKGGIGHAGPREIHCSEAFCEWLFDKRLNGGGCFVDEACYLINLYRNYVGEIARVGAITSQMGWRDYLPPDVEDNSVAILQFESGALGTIDAKWGQIGPYPISSSFHGTEGTIILSRGEFQVFSPKQLPAGLQGWVRVVDSSRTSGRGGAEQRHFVDVVKGRAALMPEVSPAGALRTQAVIEAVYEAAASARIVSVADVLRQHAPEAVA